MKLGISLKKAYTYNNSRKYKRDKCYIVKPFKLFFISEHVAQNKSEKDHEWSCKRYKNDCVKQAFQITENPDVIIKSKILRNKFENPDF